MSRSRVVCSILACASGLLPPFCARSAAQSSTPRFSIAGPAGSESALSTGAFRAGVADYGSSSALSGAGALSGVERVLEALIDYGGGAVEARNETPGLGSISTVDGLLGHSAAIELGFFSERESVPHTYLEQLTARAAGVAASHHVGAANFYVGAGMEQVRLESWHPDLPWSKDLFSVGMSAREQTLIDGRFAYSSRGYQPRLTLGAGLSLTPFVVGADLSLGSYPAVNLSASLSLF